ncbi:MAG: ComEC/Rec2 family competence protein [Eubacteriales bacterium]|nr:ComEC/Rec2 family competence protein [Eubacteriales bacterium]
MEKQFDPKQNRHPSQQSGFDWTPSESPEQRAQRRKERITLVSLISLLLLVLAVLFSLLHSQLAQDLSAAGSPAPTPTLALASANASPENSADEPAAQLPAVNAGLLVTFLDVGQGDSAVLRSPSGKTMLVDGGPRGSFPIIDRYLTSLGVVGLDVVVASHVHADHIGGLISVVDTYPVADFYYPPFDAESETYFELLDALKESQATVHQPYAGVDTLIPWDDQVEVRILAPYDTIYDDFNDTSYIIRVSYQNTAVLFTGDSSELGEKLALKAQPNHYFKADVLKVAHHGSSDATFEKFLDAVSPAIAVISVGRDNDYGHPHQSLLDRLSERGITIYRTDEDGTITLLLDGTRVTVIK